MRLIVYSTFLLSLAGFLRADVCQNPNATRITIIPITLEQQRDTSADTQAAIEVESQFADALALKIHQLSNYCLVLNGSSFDATHRASESVVFEVRAVTSLDPHTPNIAAVAVNVYDPRVTMPHIGSLAPIPILIEKEPDFETGARIVMHEWTRNVETSLARLRSKDR